VPETVDIAIAGGGVSGLYTAWRLLCSGAGRPPTVRVYEASDRTGGRLHTIAVPGSSTSVELGAMRFPVSHVLVSSLLAKLGVATEPFPNLQLQQVYLRGRGIGISPQGNPVVDLPFLLAGSETSNPFQLLVSALQRIVPNALHMTAAEWDKLLGTGKIAGRPFCDWGFWNLIQSVVSNEAYELIQAAIGIESALANWNAGMSLPMMAQLIADFIANKFNRPSKGWSCLPMQLEQDILKVQPGSVNRQHKLASVRLCDDPAHPIEFVFSTPGDYTVRAAKAVLALPRAPLEQLHWDASLKARTPHFRESLARVGQISAFRDYLVYEKPWWQTACGWSHGYSVTDLPLRQVFYGAGLGGSAADNNSVLMASYSDFHSVEFWRGLVALDAEPTMVMEQPTPGDPLLESVESQLRVIHGYSRAFPKVASTGYADWSHNRFGAAWHAWRPGGDPHAMSKEVRQLFPPVPLYVCGEAYSCFQGWVEGALGSAEAMLREHFGLPAPAWLSGGSLAIV